MAHIGFTMLLCYLLASVINIDHVSSASVAEILFTSLSNRLDSSLEEINERLDRVVHSVESDGHNFGTVSDTVDLQNGKQNTLAADLINVKHTVLKTLATEKTLLRHFIKEYENKFEDLEHNVQEMLSDVNDATRKLNESLNSNLQIDNNMKCLQSQQQLLGDRISMTCRHRGSCNDKWRLIATTSTTGAVTQGSKSDLIAAVLSGSEVRIQLEDSGYLTSVQNVHTIGDNLCAQALFHISKANYHSFQDNAYWWFLNVCTTGQTHIVRYYVGNNTPAGTSTVNYAVKWFVRSMQNTPLKHTSGNTVMFGNVLDLVDDVKTGSDVRVVDECGGYSVTMDNVQVSTDNIAVVGQSLFHVSQQQAGSIYQFQGNDYWWFTNWVSDSNFHITRWTIGEHVNRGDTSTTKAMTWYTDTCWQLAYKHDADGNELEGSLDFLRMAVLRGHRIKLLYGDNTVSVEPDEISVRGDHVNAVILRMVRKLPADITLFDTGAEWDWRILTTTGTETTLRMNVGEHSEQGRTTGTRSVAWYIDTRPWTKVLENTKTGSVVSGSKADLIAAINKGARVRYTLKFSNQATTAHEADNLAIDGTEVGATHVRSVSLQNAGGREVQFQNNPYWWFTISATTGKVDMSRWTVGIHTDRGHTSDTANMEWFVNY